MSAEHSMISHFNTRLASRYRRLYHQLQPAVARIQSLSDRFRLKPTIYYVSDGLGWILDEVGNNIALRSEDIRVNVVPVSRYTGYRKSVLHFASPAILLRNDVYRNVHPSNRIILTWTHGLPDSIDANVQEQLINLQQARSRILRIEVLTLTALNYLQGQGISSEELVHIPLGIDTTLFSPTSQKRKHEIRQSLGIPQDAICIGSFQKDSPGFNDLSDEMKWAKGPDILIETLSCLADQYPIFVLLTAPSRGYVIKHLERLGIPYRHDNLTHPHQLPAYYQALDIYLITSRDEGGPMSFLEASACGIPVVSTKMGIPLDAIQHGKNGMLAEKGDIADLASCVSQLIADQALRQTVGENARETMRQYDWSFISRKYADDLYKPLLKTIEPK